MSYSFLILVQKFRPDTGSDLTANRKEHRVVPTGILNITTGFF